MKLSEIHIRDPFVLVEDGKYYMYGTRAAGFGIKTGGFDVYVSTDLEDWSEPYECFNSEKYGMNYHANWAPEVHKYNGAYYMFATFTNEATNDSKKFILGDDETVYAYSSIDATFNGTTVTYVACDDAVILGWVFSGVPAGYVPSAAVIVE